ncbi:MAG: DUF1425 domain-containing protein [Phycisphaera sp.]|nr:DUF1425 domain-containing protein [Phycisphaera sp.]
MMTRLKTLSLLALALGLFAMTGCKSPPTAGRTDKLTTEEYPINVVDSSLKHGLVFGTARVTPTDGVRPMRVVQAVRNVESYAINLQYQFMFFDDSMSPRDAIGGWRYIQLPPKVERYIEATAIDTQSTRWRLEVRSAK